MNQFVHGAGMVSQEILGEILQIMVFNVDIEFLDLSNHCFNNYNCFPCYHYYLFTLAAHPTLHLLFCGHFQFES